MQRALRPLLVQRRVARGAASCGAVVIGTLLALTAPARAAPERGGDEAAGGESGAAGPADGPAFVRTEERTPRAGTPLIANKLYPMQGRFELSALFDYSLGDKYVEHLGGQGAIAYHIFDWLALEGFGGYLVGDESNIAKLVRNTGKSSNLSPDQCFSESCEPQLPDMWQATWFAGADVQWAPLYGKISAVSEYDLNFQLYLLGGAGAEGITRRLNGDANNDSVANDFDAPQVRVSANYGLGIRLMPWRYVALRAELRSYNGFNPNVEEHDKEDEEDCNTGYLVDDPSGDYCVPDISSNTMLQVGLSFIF